MNPWKNFEQAVCLPDKCQCEGVRDAFIRQPSSFWSSLAYVFAGVSIFRYVKDRSMDLKVWTLVCVIMGLSSMLGHMSYIRFTLAIDFASIALVMSFFGIWNLLTNLKLSYPKIFIILSIYYCLLVSGMYALDKYGKISMVFLIFTFAIADMLKVMGMRFLKARTLQLSLLVLSISFGVYMMDENHIFCEPGSLYQLHALWHMGTALSLFLYGKWRFDEKNALNLNLNLTEAIQPAE